MEDCLQLFGFLFFLDPFQVLWMPKLITQYITGIHAELIKKEASITYFYEPVFQRFPLSRSLSKSFSCYLLLPYHSFRAPGTFLGSFLLLQGLEEPQHSLSADLQGDVLVLFSFVFVDFQSIWLKKITCLLPERLSVMAVIFGTALAFISHTRS